MQSQFNAEKGLAYLQCGNYKEAEEFADTALELNHDNVSAIQLQEWLPKK
jgi:tetratricopeptide (TPR) repeat protein